MTAARPLVALVALLAATTALAQPMRRGRGAPRFVERMFPPRLVMRHQDAIALGAEQRDRIKQAMTETERSLVDLRWALEAELEKLAQLLDADAVDEAAALAQADRVMQAEQRLKKAHLTLLIRIKNVLTPAQREKLQALRGRDREPPEGPED